MKLRQRWAWRLAAVATIGTCYQLFGGCSLSGLGKLNPCGTVLECDPYLYTVTTRYDGPGADPEIDPFCTFPPLCPDSPGITQ